MRRIPIRLRVAGAFAVAMAVVLAATSWFLYARLGSHLTLALDRELRLRADDLAALAREPGGSISALSGGRLVERGEGYAQLVGPRGKVLQATSPLGTTSLLGAAELRRARRQTILANRSSVPGLDEPSRLLATPIDRGGRRLVLVVGATRQDRAETLSSLRDELLIAGPIALLLATLTGYGLAGLALRPVESMRRRAAEISAETPGERLPVPRTGDEVERLGETLNEMLSRLEQALERERRVPAQERLGEGRPPPPAHPSWQQRFGNLYRGRAAVEREFGRLKHDYGLAPLRVRGLEKVALHADLTMLARLSQALARARAVPLAA